MSKAGGGKASEDAAGVWTENKADGTYVYGYCSYNDLYAAELAKSKGRNNVTIGVYNNKMLAGASVNHDFNEVFRANPDNLSDAPDMTSLMYLEEPNMLKCLQTRYERDQIYTNISSVLVAINPYRQLGIYTSDQMLKYRGQRRVDTLTPHIFALAEKAYQELLLKDEDQSILCCGESGSGKTESTKMLMRYLTNVAHMKPTASGEAAYVPNADTASELERQVLDANPLLEAFGNARTLMNDNSSRFAKFTKLFFWKDPEDVRGEARIVGAHTETYLLERSRVVNVNQGERNYHIFYQLCAGSQVGSDNAPMLPPAASFKLLASGGCLTLQGVSDQEKFNQVTQSFTSMGVDDGVQKQLFRALAAVLYIGNIEFDPKAEGKELSSMFTKDSAKSVAIAADLLGVTKEALERRLAMRKVKVGSEVYEKKLEFDDANENKEAIAKSLYNSIFNWVVACINRTLYKGDEEDLHWIGILDVFGFECFEKNSFEQFCINFANERLQNFFNVNILKNEQDEYRREGIFWVPIDIPDNSDAINLISSKPSGIICLLDSACIQPKGNPQTFHANLFAVHSQNPRLARANAPVGKAAAGGKGAPAPAPAHARRKSIVGGPGAAAPQPFIGFTLKHYAGPVTYNVNHFLIKNADSTHPDTLELFSNSASETVVGLFAEEYNASKNSVGGKRFRSVGSVFLEQLNNLMNMLERTTPYFVRCASPNAVRAPNKFLASYVRPQLRCGGLVEALKMLKCGYPSRVRYQLIFEQYGQALKPMPPNVNQRNFCEAVLAAFGMGRSNYQLGITKCFFKPGKQEFLQSVFRKGGNSPITPEIAAAIRKWLTKRRIQRMCAAVYAFVKCAMRLARMRAAAMFRKMVRRACIYIQTFRHLMLRVRKRLNARLNGALALQHAWRKHVRAVALKRCLAEKIRERRKKKLDAQLAMAAAQAAKMEEAAVKAQLAANKRREEEEKARLEAIRQEALEKERLLKQELESRESQFANMQKELEEIKKRSENKAEEAEFVKKLKLETDRMREENEAAAREAKMIVEQKEKEYREKEEELLRIKMESEQKQRETEEKAAELVRQKEEERLAREAALEALKQETERVRAEHERKAQEAVRLLEEREAENQRKADELAKLQAEAARLKNDQEISEQSKRERELELRRKEEEQERLKNEIERMKDEVAAEAEAARLELLQREQENYEKERELRNMKYEAERLEREFEERTAMLQQQREHERQMAEEELRRMREAAEITKRVLEEEARKQQEMLRDREEENRRKEAALSRMEAETTRMREQHEAMLEDARRRLKEQNDDAARQIQLLHKSLEMATQASEMAKRQQEEEAQRILEERLKAASVENASQVERIRDEYEKQITVLKAMLLEREQEMEVLGMETETETQEHSGLLTTLQARVKERDEQLRQRDQTIAELNAELTSIRVAAEEVNEISQRLMTEALEEAKQREKKLEAEISNLTKRLVEVSAKANQGKGLNRFGFGGPAASAAADTPSTPAPAAPATPGLKPPSGLAAPKTGLPTPGASKLAAPVAGTPAAAKTPAAGGLRPPGASGMNPPKSGMPTPSGGAARPRSATTTVATPNGALAKSQSSTKLAAPGAKAPAAPAATPGKSLASSASATSIPDRSRGQSTAAENKTPASKLAAPAAPKPAPAPPSMPRADEETRMALAGLSVGELFDLFLEERRDYLNVQAARTEKPDIFVFGPRRLNLKAVDGCLKVRTIGGLEDIETFLEKSNMVRRGSISGTSIASSSAGSILSIGTPSTVSSNSALKVPSVNIAAARTAMSAPVSPAETVSSARAPPSGLAAPSTGASGASTSRLPAPASGLKKPSGLPAPKGIPVKK